MYKQKFYSALKDQFIGEEIQGDSGFINLMKIKKKYYENIKSDIRNMIEEEISDSDEEKEIFKKLYTFFDSYLNESGTPFFNDTQIHKNLYEKVYSDKEDVSLFWKTENLYYVKTEKNYSNMEIEKEGYKYIFDASEIENKADNNKKDVGFYLVKADKKNKVLNFKIKYQRQNSYDKLKEILDIKGTTKLQDFLINDFNNSDEYSNIKFNDDLEIRDIGNKSVKRRMLDIREKEDTLTDLVTIDFAAEGLKDICEYLINRKKFDIKREDIKKVFYTYERQEKIDYFIHKNADKFLKEQFKQYLFNYIYDNEIVLEDEGLKRAQQLNKLKKIAFKIIEYIAEFENELREIWEKPKFVRKSNYVLTIDKLKNNIELIKEIINHPGFKDQLLEWKKLYEKEKDYKGNESKKIWKEFDFINNFKKEDIIKKGKLNLKYKNLPIDTKFYKDIKHKILDVFDDLDEVINGIAIKGDNYQALNSIFKLYNKKLDLIYIDPPFNTESQDFYYEDKFANSAWLTLIKNRLDLSKKLLSEKGSFYLHLDYNASHYGRLLLDDVFGENNFLNEIIWHYQAGTAPNNGFAKKHDNILSYSKENRNNIFNPVRLHVKDESIYPKEDENGRKYRMSGNNNETRYYADEGRKADDVWTWLDRKENNIIQVFHAHPQQLFFPTQKPEKLTKRIIESSSEENSYISDFFAGSGTTIASAHKMNRKWICVEMGKHFYSKIIPRMKRVLAGDESGISDEVDWSGGGFFKYYELESYEDVLKRAKYKKNRDEINKYSFMSDEKMLDVLELDYEEENIKVKFENLYPDVDIAETLSNLLGKNIKKLNDKRVIFEDGKEIIFEEMTFEKYPKIKSLIWWGKVDNG
jgi:adenine specific DNA methylase Mod